ncbi:MAG: aminotransferase class III-fold pyridoxal phosphate-dependent enzyme [Nitrososphaerota archaeon]|nr:aminotransferase class III-fold pyridoxal phosphate-dependent enzyme [Nitrososphaerota archaeon]
MVDADKLLTKEGTSALTRKYTFGTWRYQRGWNPIEVVDAEGCHFTDASGKKYLDFSSQLMCCNLGHKNKAVIEAIVEQARSLPYIAPSFTCDVRAELSNLLLEVLPKGLEKFFYSTSGTEANEAAIKIARLYTGKYKIISRYRSYHGSTGASIAATGDMRRFAAEPAGKVDGIVFAPDVDTYRSPFGVEFEDRAIASANYIDYMIRNEGNVAAVLIEPVVGTNGVLVPPKEYLPMLREVTDKNGVLLIVDEVMSGWGRTGEWFAVDHWKVTPDILTTAKGITGAYAPLGLTATTREIADYFEDHYFAHGHTYEAHPLTLAPAVAAIREYQRLDLISGAKKKGEYLGRRLSELKAKHPCVGDVRGLGLFWAVELVKDRKTKEPFFTAEDKLAGRPSLLGKVGADMMGKGVYLLDWLSHFVVAPPLIVTQEEIDFGVDALDGSLSIADKEVKS